MLLDPSTVVAVADLAGAGFARDLLIILATAGLVAAGLRRLRMATIPGYLIAGAIIGPSALGLVGGEESSAGAISGLAIVLLMFTVGLHLDIGGVRGGLLPMATIGALSTLGSVLVGWPIAALFGVGAPAALAISMAMSISSTAVVLRLLQTRRELHRVRGRVIFGVLLLQDLSALAMLALIPAVAAWSQDAPMEPAAGGSLAGPLGLLARSFMAIGGIGLLIIGGKLVLPKVLREVAQGTSPEAGSEVLLVVSAAIALGAAVLSAWLGFNPELGAFLAGFLLSATPFRYQLAGQLTPLRDLFMAVFFTTVGLGLSAGEVAEGWWIVLLGVAALLTVKAVVIGAVSWATGATGAVAVYVGLALAQGGEFSLVMLAAAAEAGAIDPSPYAYTIAVVVLSLMVTPMMLDAARAAARRASWIPAAPWARRSPLAKAPPPEADGAEGAAVEGKTWSAIIAGFGPVGRAVADSLEKSGVTVAVVELNPRTVERQAGLGRTVVYGDASNPEVLESVGLATADAVILTMPDEDAMLRACRSVRSLRPDIFIAARTNALSRALQAMQLGADHAVVEEMVTAEAMASQVLLKVRQRIAGEDTGPKLYQAAGPGRG